MTITIMERVKAAKERLPAIAPQDAEALRGHANVLFVDVRDADEIAASGKIAGALNVSRGMLEFRADDASPMHNPAFAKDKTIVIYCASGARSALAGVTLLDMGYTDVRLLAPFKDWAESGLPTE